MNTTDQIATLDHWYMLDVDTPSEKWTEEAQSEFSAPVNEYVERASEAAHSAQMLGLLLIAGWLAFFGAVSWGLWSYFHG